MSVPLNECHLSLPMHSSWVLGSNCEYCCYFELKTSLWVRRPPAIGMLKRKCFSNLVLAGVFGGSGPHCSMWLSSLKGHLSTFCVFETFYSACWCESCKCCLEDSIRLHYCCFWWSKLDCYSLTVTWYDLLETKLEQLKSPHYILVSFPACFCANLDLSWHLPGCVEFTTNFESLAIRN